MIVGLVTPVLTLLPGAHAHWERTATFDDVVEIARAADRAGFHHLTCSEHVAVPIGVADTRGARYWDPLATFGALAMVTEHLRFATHVLVLGYHHPLAIAKRYGTLDRICGGRLILGVGVGSLREEFELLDAEFTGRGDRADEAMVALRAAFGRLEPSFAGDNYCFDDFLVDPHGIQERIPMWVGGRTARSLRRAVEHGDGWVPFGLRRSELAAMISRARDTDAWQERDADLEILLEPRPPIDPIGDPRESAARMRAVLDVGGTGLNLRLVHHSRAHYIEQIEAAAGILPTL